jgi:hypothetical protein
MAVVVADPRRGGGAGFPIAGHFGGGVIDDDTRERFGIDGAFAVGSGDGGCGRLQDLAILQ